MFEVSQMRDTVLLGLLTTPKYHVLPYITTVNAWVLPASMRVPPGQGLELSYLRPSAMHPIAGMQKLPALRMIIVIMLKATGILNECKQCV